MIDADAVLDPEAQAREYVERTIMPFLGPGLEQLLLVAKARGEVELEGDELDTADLGFASKVDAGNAVSDKDNHNMVSAAAGAADDDDDDEEDDAADPKKFNALRWLSDYLRLTIKKINLKTVHRNVIFRTASKGKTLLFQLILTG